ncbi:hypothetical protein TrST_g11205 [Triparma strigata]|uniref:25S rRNA (uridine-N(3))-methyltransferase BMT5-like domain-containing protein n=1 Tax=Triparma strigata TaxID=1606541 RepID=A0A9W7BJ49_9STRA|nr:hypothetical protein TrST_g11205 [Triparma strigata]
MNLIVGDGDLSFSLNFARGMQMRLICTVFEDDEASLVAVYPTAAENLQSLRELHPRVDVIFGVDATKIPLRLNADIVFDRIIFNFPQTVPSERKHRKVQYQRELLENFFRACSSPAVLTEMGIVQVALLAGQGGMDIEGSYKRPRDADSWKIVENAARVGFIVMDAPLFSACHNPVGFRGTEESFKLEGSRYYECRQAGGVGMPQLEPPRFAFVLSFWADDGWLSSEGKFLESVAALGEEEKIDIRLTLAEGDYIDPATGKRARKYKIDMCAGSRTALSRAKAVGLLERVKDHAVAIEGGERRG